MDMMGRIKLIRGSKSQDTFAQEVGVSKMTVGRWERGERTPDSDDLNRILKAYPDINPTWLLTGEGNMRPEEEGLKVLENIVDEFTSEQKEESKKLLLAVMEGIEDAQRLKWYDLSLLTPREVTALVYTLFTLFSEEKLKHLVNKEFIAGQSGFIYLLIRDFTSIVKMQSNSKEKFLMVELSDELNLFGKSIEILSMLLASDKEEKPI